MKVITCREKVSRALFSASQRTSTQSLSKEGKSSTSTSHWHQLLNIVLTASASCSSPMSWCSCSSSRNCFITFKNSRYWAHFAEKSRQPVHKPRCYCPLCAPRQARVSQKLLKDLSLLFSQKGIIYSIPLTWSPSSGIQRGL